MTNPLPIPDDLWNRVPPDAQAAIAAAFWAMPQQRPVQRLRVGRRGVATGRLGPPAARRSGDDRPGGEGEVIGGELRGHSRTLFRARHRVRDGTTAWESFPRSMRDLRRRVRAAPERGSKCPGAPTSATCWEFLKGAGGLGTFARVKGIEPTNDAVERAPRRAVIWRRISSGPDGERGSRFVERMPTVVATGRQQGRNVLDDLTSCFEAQLAGQGIPPLPPAETVEIRVA